MVSLVSTRLGEAQAKTLFTAGTLLHRTLTHLGHPRHLISVHHLQKGTNVHCDDERGRMATNGAERIVVLDQGSRPGRALVPPNDEETVRRTLIIDHHMSDEVCEISKRLCLGVRSMRSAVAGVLSSFDCMPYLAYSDRRPPYIRHVTGSSPESEGGGGLESRSRGDRRWVVGHVEMQLR